MTATMKQIRKWAKQAESSHHLETEGFLWYYTININIPNRNISVRSDNLREFKYVCTALMDAEGYDWRAT